ncbi:MAG TPA: ammonia channel protein, partial [Phenylobacterium sp.]|nr:ammonia channel protein [Phenylobacterium sp.]
DALASYTMMGQFIVQAKAVAVSICWSAVASSIVFFIIKFTVGLKVSQDVEEEGLDIAEHGERAYHY